MTELILAFSIIAAVLAGIGLAMTVRATKNASQRDLSREVGYTVSEAIKGVQESNASSLRLTAGNIMDANDRYNKSVVEQINRLTADVQKNLAEIRGETNAQLEKMRATVDEKLAENLEKRFEVIATRMDGVLKGLGEMNALSEKVGSLNSVLTNVKARGTWGEVSLNALLEQILTEKQFRRTVQVKRGSAERVDFAVVMPGKGEEVLLPIDSKFPVEDYQRIVEASATGDVVALHTAEQQLERRILAEARSIREKYVNPPMTTDFAVMYLPTEGLYAEVLRRHGLTERLQNECKVTVAGPTTISALLNSLQLGFQTLAIEKSSLEVKKSLLQFRKEFIKFAEDMEKTQAQISRAGTTIEGVIKRTARIQDRLGKISVGELGEDELLDLGDAEN